MGWGWTLCGLRLEIVEMFEPVSYGGLQQPVDSMSGAVLEGTRCSGQLSGFANQFFVKQEVVINWISYTGRALRSLTTVDL